MPWSMVGCIIYRSAYISNVFCVPHCCVSLSSTTKTVHEAHVKAFDVLRECYKVLVTVLVNHLNVSHKNFILQVLDKIVTRNHDGQH